MLIFQIISRAAFGKAYAMRRNGVFPDKFAGFMTEKGVFSVRNDREILLSHQKQVLDYL